MSRWCSFYYRVIICKKEHFPLPSAQCTGLRKVIVMALKLKDNEALALKSLKDALLQKYDVIDFRVFGSKIKGLDMPDSDIDVMIELAEYDSFIASEIDDIIFEINLAHDAFISAVIFGKKEIEEGPLSESPIYKVCKREGVSL